MKREKFLNISKFSLILAKINLIGHKNIMSILKAGFKFIWSRVFIYYVDMFDFVIIKVDSTTYYLKTLTTSIIRKLSIYKICFKIKYFRYFSNINNFMLILVYDGLTIKIREKWIWKSADATPL